MKTTRKQRFIALPGLKATSCLTVVLLIFLETVLLSTVSNCAKTFFMHWNTSNSIFRIDNTDHIIDVNKGNLAFEYDQVHIICPVYEPGTFDNETEKYIIYNVSKVEYETCRITNANPRIIAICDKPQKLMYFTITFRPFTPQPGGLEFLPGNDYYFISTSSKDDLHRRIGGRCSTNNMKVVFKVCCAPEADSPNVTSTSLDSMPSRNTSLVTRQPPRGGTMTNANTTGNDRVPPLTINTSNVVKSTMTWMSRDNGDNQGGNGYRHSIPITSTISVQSYVPHPTSSRPFINSAINVNKYNKNNNNNNKNYNNNNYNHSNNAPSHKPTKKTNEYDKHPNEVVKNEELTYNNNGGFSLMGNHRRTINHSTIFLFRWMPQQLSFIVLTLTIVFFLNYLLIVQSKFTPCITLQQLKDDSLNTAKNTCESNNEKEESGDDDGMECDADNQKSASEPKQKQTATETAVCASDVNKIMPIASAASTLNKQNETKKCSTGHTALTENKTKFMKTSRSADEADAATATATTNNNNYNYNNNLTCGPLSALKHHHRLINKNVTNSTPTDTKTDIIAINTTSKTTTDTNYKIQKYDIITLRKVFNSFNDGQQRQLKSVTKNASVARQVLTTMMLTEPTIILVHNLNETMKNRICARYDDVVHTNRAGLASVVVDDVANTRNLFNCIINENDAFAVVSTTNSDKTTNNNKNTFKINHIMRSCNNVNITIKCNCKLSLENTTCIRHRINNINGKLQQNSIIRVKMAEDDKQLTCTYTKCALANQSFQR